MTQDETLDLPREATIANLETVRRRETLMNDFSARLISTTRAIEAICELSLWSLPGETDRMDGGWRRFFQALLKDHVAICLSDVSDGLCFKNTIRQKLTEASGSHLNISIPDPAERTLGRSTPTYMATQNDFERPFDAEVAS